MSLAPVDGGEDDIPRWLAGSASHLVPWGPGVQERLRPHGAQDPQGPGRLQQLSHDLSPGAPAFKSDFGLTLPACGSASTLPNQAGCLGCVGTTNRVALVTRFLPTGLSWSCGYFQQGCLDRVDTTDGVAFVVWLLPKRLPWHRQTRPAGLGRVPPRCGPHSVCCLLSPRRPWSNRAAPRANPHYLLFRAGWRGAPRIWTTPCRRGGLRHPVC